MGGTALIPAEGGRGRGFSKFEFLDYAERLSLLFFFLGGGWGTKTTTKSVLGPALTTKPDHVNLIYRNLRWKEKIDSYEFSSDLHIRAVAQASMCMLSHTQ